MQEHTVPSTTDRSHRRTTVAGLSAIVLAGLAGLAIAGPDKAQTAEKADQPEAVESVRVAPAVVEIDSEGIAEVLTDAVDLADRADVADVRAAPRVQSIAQPAQRSTASKSKSKMVIVSEDDDNRIEVTIVDGEISAELNGKELPKSRIKKHDGKLFILSDEGEKLFEFKLGEHSIATTGAVKLATPGDSQAVWATSQGFTTPDPERRKVVLGITMSEPDEGLLEYLELKPGSAVKIDRIFDGLPAARAGLRSNDIIVSIDGKKPVTIDTVGEVLDKKDPGDPVKLYVLRKGEKNEFVVKLDKYREGVFSEGEGRARIRVAPGGGSWTAEAPGGRIKGPSVPTPPGMPRGYAETAPGVYTWRSDDGNEEVKILIEKLAKQAKQQQGNVQLHSEEIDRLHEHAMKLAQEHARRATRLRLHQGDGNEFFMVDPGNVQGRIIQRRGDGNLTIDLDRDVELRFLESMEHQLHKHLEEEIHEHFDGELHERLSHARSSLEGVEARLERIEERLERLEKLLRRMAERD